MLKKETLSQAACTHAREEGKAGLGFGASWGVPLSEGLRKSLPGKMALGQRLEGGGGVRCAETWGEGRERSGTEEMVWLRGDQSDRLPRATARTSALPLSVTWSQRSHHMRGEKSIPSVPACIHSSPVR